MILCTFLYAAKIADAQYSVDLLDEGNLTRISYLNIRYDVVACVDVDSK